jgi:hypothetical protein
MRIIDLSYAKYGRNYDIDQSSRSNDDIDVSSGSGDDDDLPDLVFIDEVQRIEYHDERKLKLEDDEEIPDLQLSTLTDSDLDIILDPIKCLKEFDGEMSLEELIAINMAYYEELVAVNGVQVSIKKNNNNNNSCVINN